MPSPTKTRLRRRRLRAEAVQQPLTALLDLRRKRTDQTPGVSKSKKTSECVPNRETLEMVAPGFEEQNLLHGESPKKRRASSFFQTHEVLSKMKFLLGPVPWQCQKKQKDNRPPFRQGILKKRDTKERSLRSEFRPQPSPFEASTESPLRRPSTCAAREERSCELV